MPTPPFAWAWAGNVGRVNRPDILLLVFRPNGAMECSRGWSGAAAERPDAEPVESG